VNLVLCLRTPLTRHYAMHSTFDATVTEAVVSTVRKLRPDLLKTVPENVPENVPESVPQKKPPTTFDPSEFVAEMKVLCNAIVFYSIQHQRCHYYQFIAHLSARASKQ
jgi:hypothetical protein